MSNTSKITPKSNAIEKIEYYIIENHLSANDRIPAERDLSQMWGISRTTIRNAIDHLVGRDSLYKIEGAGTFVSMKKHARNIIGVNTLTKNLRELGVSYTTQILSFEIVKADKRIADKLQLKLGQDVYELIRLRSLNSLPCFLETMYLSVDRCPDLQKYYSEKSSIYSIYQNVYKIRPVGGDERISITYATPTEADLLDINLNDSLFFTSGTTYTKDDVPLEYYKIVFRSDQFRFNYMIEDKVDDKENRDEK